MQWFNIFGKQAYSLSELDTFMQIMKLPQATSQLSLAQRLETADLGLSSNKT